MNLETWRKLGEALEWVDSGYVAASASGIIALAYAARQTYDRYQECDNPECDDGVEYCPCYTHLPGDTSKGCYGGEAKRPCPSCGGSGLKEKE